MLQLITTTGLLSYEAHPLLLTKTQKLRGQFYSLRGWDFRRLVFSLLFLLDMCSDVNDLVVVILDWGIKFCFRLVETSTRILVKMCMSH